MPRVSARARATPSPVTIPTLSTEAALDALRARREGETGAGIAAFFSSEVGGIVVDTALMGVAIDDHLVHRGHGVFDTATIAGGGIYRLDIHLERLLASAGLARITHPWSLQDLRDIVVATVAASQLRDGSIRYWLTAGTGNFAVGPGDCRPGFYCVAIDVFQPTGSDDPMREGLREYTVTDVPMKPELLATIKSNNYLLNVLTHMDSADRGGQFGVLVHPDGTIAEGAVVNVCFVTDDGTLLTPPFDGILKGTTVRRVLDHARDVLVPGGVLRAVEQRPISVTEVRGRLREMFMLGGDTHVFPVVAWDDEPVGDGSVGPIASGLLEFLETEAAGGSDGQTADERIVVRYPDV